MIGVNPSISKSIHFGTDGWRAVIGQEFTLANLERITQAYADFLTNEKKLHNAEIREGVFQGKSTQPIVVIGYDRRLLSECFARKAGEVIAGNNYVPILFDESVPTPLVSWSVRNLKGVGGIVITASHNPPEFNGFKLKAEWGGSVPSEIGVKVESFIDFNSPRCAVLKTDRNSATETCITTYRSQIASLVDLERLRSVANKVIVDPMHGSGGLWVESFLHGGNLQIETIRANRDPLFGGVNPEPIDCNLGLSKQKIVKSRALVGLATDGDADRVGIVNELGETMSMHQVAPLLLLHLLRNRKMRGGIVTTFSQSVLMKRIAAAYNLPLYETPIGFKYIAELMLKENILFGAEESGGIGIQGHIPERDGILNSLLFLEATVFAGKTPSAMVKDLFREFGEFYFNRLDLHIETSRAQEFVENIAGFPPTKIAGEKIIDVAKMDGTKLIFEDESWLLFRASGTEPVLRIYSEATSKSKLNKLLKAGRLLFD